MRNSFQRHHMKNIFFPFSEDLSSVRSDPTREHRGRHSLTGELLVVTATLTPSKPQDYDPWLVQNMLEPSGKPRKGPRWDLVPTSPEAVTHGFPQVPTLLGPMFLAHPWRFPRPQVGLAFGGIHSFLLTAHSGDCRASHREDLECRE